MISQGEFQSRLKKTRESLGISQTDLAREIGVTQPHLSYIESGKRDLTQERYERIMEAFAKHSQK